MTNTARKKRALVVAGPTCSGKSALAVDLAERIGGAVINADSMQVYRELHLLTARPGAAEAARAPHLLYGVRQACEPGTAAWWRGAALAAMEQVHAEGRTPILCGGTGMYLTALWQGLAEIPDPGPAARAQARTLLADEGPAALHGRLAEVDPETATGLRLSDGQRLARAWEVWAGTGRGLAAWQSCQVTPVTDWSVQAVVLDPPRTRLRAAIASRFTLMLCAGAIEEVRALLALRLDPALPVMRAHGVPELGAYLRGEIDLDEAARRAVAAQGRYTKRQATWFRHRPVVPANSIAAAAATHRLVALYSCLAQLPDSFTAIF